jgi:regulation of enolase protein 1 (concanavalin A-like superfamily)
MEPFEIATLPAPLRWLNRPLAWQVASPDTLVVDAGPESDWFADPAADVVKDNAPVAFFTPPDEAFTLSAKVRVDFISTFDAGVLMIKASQNHWAKLCFEYSPQERPMIVSVVTRGRSDDCNSATIEGHEVYLRVARLGATFAFHYSEDGRVWHMVRYFTLGAVSQLQLGLSSQSPTGRGCRTFFFEVHYEARLLQDIRSGE